MEPIHPGRALRKLLQGRNKTVVGAAKELGISPNALSNIVNCHVAITPTMAIRIEQWDGGSADSWLAAQLRFDLEQARKVSLQKGSSQ